MAAQLLCSSSPPPQPPMPPPLLTTQELLSSQTVCDLVATVTNLDPQKICEKIVEQSTHMWKVEEGDYRDDITVVVLTFPWLDSYD